MNINIIKLEIKNFYKEVDKNEEKNDYINSSFTSSSSWRYLELQS